MGDGVDLAISRVDDRRRPGEIYTARTLSQADRSSTSLSLDLKSSESPDGLWPFTRLTHLDLQWRADEAGWRAVGERLSRLRSLAMRDAKTTSLCFLEAFPNLVALRIDSATQLRALDFPVPAPALRVLLIENVPRVDALDGIESVAGTLTRLQIEQLTSKTSTEWFDTLAPLAALSELRHLLVRPVPRDRSFEAIGHLRSLETFKFRPYSYPVEELGWLRGALPSLPTELRADESGGIHPCGRCGTEHRSTTLYGLRRPMWVCLVREAAKITDGRAKFDAGRQRGEDWARTNYPDG